MDFLVFSSIFLLFSSAAFSIPINVAEVSPNVNPSNNSNLEENVSEALLSDALPKILIVEQNSSSDPKINEISDAVVDVEADAQEDEDELETPKKRHRIRVGRRRHPHRHWPRRDVLPPPRRIVIVRPAPVAEVIRPVFVMADPNDPDNGWLLLDSKADSNETKTSNASNDAVQEDEIGALEAPSHRRSHGSSRGRPSHWRRNNRLRSFPWRRHPIFFPPPHPFVFWRPVPVVHPPVVRPIVVVANPDDFDQNRWVFLDEVDSNSTAAPSQDSIQIERNFNLVVDGTPSIQESRKTIIDGVDFEAQNDQSSEDELAAPKAEDEKLGELEAPIFWKASQQPQSWTRKPSLPKSDPSWPEEDFDFTTAKPWRRLSWSDEKSDANIAEEEVEDSKDENPPLDALSQKSNQKNQKSRKTVPPLNPKPADEIQEDSAISADDQFIKGVTSPFKIGGQFIKGVTSPNKIGRAILKKTTRFLRQLSDEINDDVQVAEEEIETSDELEAPKSKKGSKAKVKSGLESVLQKTVPPLIKDLAGILKPFDELAEDDGPEPSEPEPSPFQFDCKDRDDGVYVNPAKNCSHSYFMCSNQISSKQKCPAGMFYDSERFICDGYANVFACSGVHISSTVKPNEGKIIDYDCSNLENGDYELSNCISFYVSCSGGVARERNCSFGLLFDAETKRCEFPNDIPACGGRKKTTVGETSSPMPATYAPKTPSPFNIDCAKLFDGIHPDPDSLCVRHFYVCSAGQTNRIFCPNNLVFNSNSSQCDYKPKVAGCKAEILAAKGLQKSRFIKTTRSSDSNNQSLSPEVLVTSKVAMEEVVSQKPESEPQSRSPELLTTSKVPIEEVVSQEPESEPILAMDELPESINNSMSNFTDIDFHDSPIIDLIEIDFPPAWLNLTFMNESLINLLSNDSRTNFIVVLEDSLAANATNVTSKQNAMNATFVSMWIDDKSGANATNITISPLNSSSNSFNSSNNSIFGAPSKIWNKAVGFLNKTFFSDESTEAGW